MAAGTGGSRSPLRPSRSCGGVSSWNRRLREVKGLAKVTQGHRRPGMGLSGAARPAGSELPGTLTALLVHSQSRAHARVQAPSHTHMHPGTCVHGQKAHTPTLILTQAPHTCVCSHAQGNTVTHSCTRTLAQHMQVHLYTHMRTCVHTALTHVCTHVHLCTSMCIHKCTFTKVITQVCTHSHVVPPPPAWGEGPGNSSRSTSGPLAEPWPPRPEAGPPGPP